MVSERRGLVDRLVSACFALLAGAIALYVAAHLVQAIWPILMVAGAAVFASFVGFRIWRGRSSRW